MKNSAHDAHTVISSMDFPLVRLVAFVPPSVQLQITTSYFDKNTGVGMRGVFQSLLSKKEVSSLP